MKLKLTINGKSTSVSAPESTPLLWVLRDYLNMTGTKFGCGMAQCGACTVLVDGSPVRSCVTPAQTMVNKKIVTIEGLKAHEPIAQKVAQAWEDDAVVQCGYCQSGQIVSATALLKSNPKPSDVEIDDFMSGNICRCSTYKRIRDAIKSASSDLTAVSSLHAEHDDTSLSVKQYTPNKNNDLNVVADRGSDNVA